MLIVRNVGVSWASGFVTVSAAGCSLRVSGGKTNPLACSRTYAT